METLKKTRITDIKPGNKQSFRSKKLQQVEYYQNPKYYENTPFKPGFYFLHYLADPPNRTDGIYLNIPESYYNYGQVAYIHTNSQGKVCFSYNTNPYEYFKKLTNIRSNINKRHQAAVIIRICRDYIFSNNNCIVFTWEQFRKKVESNDKFNLSLIQRFISSTGKRPTIMRLFYYNYMGDSKANYIYYISSNFDQSKTIEKGSIKNSIVELSQLQELEIFKASGKAIKGFEQEAEKIIQYLQTGYHVRIKEIVLDFIKDTNGVIWFCSCKGFILDEAYLRLLQPSSVISNNKPSELYYKQYGKLQLALCKLCRINYSQDKLCHYSSVRMLLEFKQHINRRLEVSWDTSHLNIPNPEMLSQTVRICHYCYMLVTSEFDLLETCEQFSKLLSIPFKNIDREDQQQFQIQLQFMPKILVQWRVMFLFQSIELQVQFEEMNYFMIKFNDNITIYDLKKLIKNVNGQTIDWLMPVIKIAYFYIPDDKSPMKYLRENLVEIRVGLSTNWNSYILRAKTLFLDYLATPLLKKSAICSQRIFYLFDKQGIQQGSMRLHVGLSCDKQVLTQNIKVFLTKFQEVYIPENFYFSPDPFPNEWMEILGGYELDSTFGPEINDDKIYNTRLNYMDLWRMDNKQFPFEEKYRHRYNPRPGVIIPINSLKRAQSRSDRIKSSISSYKGRRNMRKSKSISSRSIYSQKEFKENKILLQSEQAKRIFETVGSFIQKSRSCSIKRTKPQRSLFDLGQSHLYIQENLRLKYPGLNYTQLIKAKIL